MRVLGLLWGLPVDLGVTQAQTHTFPSEISRLSRLRKMSLYLFLLSGAGSSPGGGECHTKPPPLLALWLVVWRVERQTEEKDRDRKF